MSQLSSDLQPRKASKRQFQATFARSLDLSKKTQPPFMLADPLSGFFHYECE